MRPLPRNLKNRAKNHALLLGLALIFALGPSTSAWPQATGGAKGGPPPGRDCARPQTKAELDACFAIRQDDAASRVAAAKVKADAANAKRAQLAADAAAKNDEDKKKREAELLEILEISRSRNVSHGNQKYRVTYGVVTEPRVREPK